MTEENRPKDLKVTVDSTQIRKDLSEEITQRVQLEEKIKQLEKEAEENKH